MRKNNLVKAAILQAAERLFQKWGINKTTMEDIAHEARKGKSTLYYYFKSKEDVLEAVAVAQGTRSSTRSSRRSRTKPRPRKSSWHASTRHFGRTVRRLLCTKSRVEKSRPKRPS